MIERIRTLSEAYGPSGAEEAIRARIQSELSSLSYAISVDELGNLIVTKNSSNASVKPFLLIASMDENGLMVIDRDSNGFLRVGSVGTSKAFEWVGQRVVFENGRKGIVQAEKTGESKDVTFAQLFIDLGGTNNDPIDAIEIGDVAVFDTSCVGFQQGIVTGKALSNRVGCVALIELLHELADSELPIVAIFTTQHQVGSRGIKPAVFTLEPAIAITLGAFAASDVPNTKQQQIAIGRGPVLMLKERNYILSSSLRDSIKQTAMEQDISFQLGLSIELETDAGHVAVSKSGVRTASLTVPVRYPRTANELFHVTDLENLVKWVHTWLKTQR